MRLRTLPVSLAGVIAGCASAAAVGKLSFLPALLCLLFALLAQIASNFANEYYDYRDGLDAPGREGPRRGVTEGDITPRAMLAATYLTLGAACIIGLSLICFGGWILLPFGIIIAVGALSYSTGPWPLSRHGLGELAVILFFGIAPVCLTFYIMAGYCSLQVLSTSLAIGLMGANVLMINNYRDIDDDRRVGKHTLAVIIGRRPASIAYLLSGIIAAMCLLPLLISLNSYATIIAAVYLLAHLLLWNKMRHSIGRQLNPLLGLTAMLMFVTSIAIFLIF